MRIPEHHRAAYERIKAEQEAPARKAAEEAQKRAEFLSKYPTARENDISRALSRRISTGDMSLPFLAIDSVFAVATSGAEEGQSADLESALESVKDQLWNQCRHLGGDAVLFADFRIEKGNITFKNAWVQTASDVWMAMVAMTLRSHVSRIDTAVTQQTISVFAQGTAVKLLPSGTPLDPRLYEQFDRKWLDMRLPPMLAADPNEPTPQV